MATTPDSDKGLYRSGVAARMAGVNVETLRIWERRYSVVSPPMSAGRQRLYSSADIKRLRLIKYLVDSGHPIGSIASLGTDELAGIRGDSQNPPGKNRRTAPIAVQRELRVALVGPFLMADQFAKTLSAGTLTIVGRCPDATLAATALNTVAADILIIEMPTLVETDLQQLALIKAACGATDVVVLYRYAPSVVIRRLRAAGHTVARATSDAAEIEAICLSLTQHTNADASEAQPSFDEVEPSPPRFDRQTLAEFSTESRTVECECPKHLADLVMDLGSFEQYSAECASRSPADAVLHLKLQRAAGLARTIIEQALVTVAIAEGYPLPAIVARSAVATAEGS